MRYPYIQIMRFFAAASVLIYHSIYFWAQTSPGVGWWAHASAVVLLSRGVTVFFAISGFVIAMVLERSTIPEFFAHRITRIYAPLYAAIIITISVKMLIWGSFPLSSLNFYAFSLFPGGTHDYILGVEWTLIYEVFFYVVMACIYMLTSHRMFLVFSWAIVILAANAYSLEFTKFLPTYYNILFSEFNLAFIFGVFAFKVRDLFPRGGGLLLAGGLCALVFFNSILGVGYWREPLCGLSAAVMVLGAARMGSSSPSLAHRLLRRGGDASYGIYLAHVPAITILLAATGITGPLALVGVIMAAGLVGLGFGMMEFACYRRLKRAIDLGFAGHWRVHRARA